MSRQAPTSVARGRPASAGWPRGPFHPRLAPRALHVWRADLDDAGIEKLGELLSAEEDARAERMLAPLTRERWIRARGVLRALLGRYLDCDPRALRFALEPGGKPILAGHGGCGGAREGAGPAGATASAPPLAFNVSHSGPLALYALSD